MQNRCLRSCACLHLWVWWLYFLFPTPPVLADNLKSNPGIKWQYFSSEEGIFTVFPAHKFRCKGSYEHRSRYVDLLAKVLITAEEWSVWNRLLIYTHDSASKLGFHKLTQERFHHRACMDTELLRRANDKAQSFSLSNKVLTKEIKLSKAPQWFWASGIFGETGMIIPSPKCNPKRLVASLRVGFVIPSLPFCDYALGHFFFFWIRAFSATRSFKVAQNTLVRRWLTSRSSHWLEFVPLSQKGSNGELICMTRLINLQNPLGKDTSLLNPYSFPLQCQMFDARKSGASAGCSVFMPFFRVQSNHRFSLSLSLF